MSLFRSAACSLRLAPPRPSPPPTWRPLRNQEVRSGTRAPLLDLDPKAIELYDNNTPRFITSSSSRRTAARRSRPSLCASEGADDLADDVPLEKKGQQPRRLPNWHVALIGGGSTITPLHQLLMVGLVLSTTADMFGLPHNTASTPTLTSIQVVSVPAWRAGNDGPMGGQALWDLQGYGIGQEASVVLVQNYFVGDRATGYKPWAADGGAAGAGESSPSTKVLLSYYDDSDDTKSTGELGEPPEPIFIINTVKLNPPKMSPFAANIKQPHVLLLFGQSPVLSLLRWRR
ncbi:hypothetical protein V8E53_010043 [Lactarius tabidus]